MNADNLVLLRGTLSRDPVVRTLPFDGSVTQLEVATQVDGRTSSVPVAVHDRSVTMVAGDGVVVTGHVHRRFFRAGGVTQSRTEVVADQVLRAGRRRRIAQLFDDAVDALRPEAV